MRSVGNNLGFALIVIDRKCPSHYTDQNDSRWGTEVPQNSLKFKYRAGHFFAAVVWVEKEIYLLIGPLGSASARSQASKGAKNELKMTKMTIQRKKITKVIRIDKQAPFLD